MRVRVEEAAKEDCDPERLRERGEQSTAEQLSLGRARVDTALLHGLHRARKRHALQKVHNKHALGHEAAHRARRHDDRRDWAASHGVRAQSTTDALHGRRLFDEIELVAELHLELRKDGVVVDRDRLDAAYALRERLERRHVAEQLRLDGRPLDLDGNLSAAVRWREDCPVDLRDRGRTERLWVEFGKDALEALVVVEQLLLNDGLDKRHRHRVDEVSESREPVRVLLREEVLPRRDNLPCFRVEALELLDDGRKGRRSTFVLLLPHHLALLLIEALLQHLLAEPQREEEP